MIDMTDNLLKKVTATDMLKCHQEYTIMQLVKNIMCPWALHDDFNRFVGFNSHGILVVKRLHVD
jgi:hypothetical protein